MEKREARGEGRGLGERPGGVSLRGAGEGGDREGPR